MKTISTAILSERLKALRGAERTTDEIAEAAGINVHTYRRYERGDNDKIPFDHLVAIGKVYGLTPNEMAALVEIWTLDEALPESDSVKRFTEVVATFLKDIPPVRRDMMIDMFTALMEVERRKSTPQETEDNSVLPDWLRKRQS